MFTIVVFAILFFMWVIVRAEPKPSKCVHLTAVEPVDTSVLDQTIKTVFNHYQSAVRLQVTMICSGGLGAEPADEFERKCHEFVKKIDDLQEERVKLVGEKYDLDFSNLAGF
jgi:hypothetical protein